MPKNRARSSALRGTAVCALLAAGVVAGTTGPAMADGVPVVVAGKWAKAAPSEAKCPKGTELIGGGYHAEPATLSNGMPADMVDMNAPSSVTPNAWVVKMHIGSARAYALCEKD